MDAPTHRMVNGVRVDLTQAEIDAIVAEWIANEPGTGTQWLAEQAAVVTQQQQAAIAALTGSEPLTRLQRAAIASILGNAVQALNAVRGWTVGLKAAVANATGSTPAAVWADFKTRVAALPQLDDLSPSQAVAAVKADIPNQINSDPT